MRALTATLLSLAALPAAGDFSLVQPIDCRLGTDCHIQQFVDHDPTDAASDHTCGPMSYDGHKGTDFALPSGAALAKGVNVLAAADGIVQGVRNSMPDALQGTADSPEIGGRECGNGVSLTHADGYETQYCHMKQGSITLRPGDAVTAGSVIGQVGLSGETEFLHLHLTVRKGDQVIDPFDPDGKITCGSPSPTTLWQTPMPSPPGGIISGGWFNDIPTFDAIKAGEATQDRFTPNDAIVAWVYLFGTQAGDRLEVVMTGPDGSGDLLRDTIQLDRTQAQAFRAFGKRAPAQGWPIGDYSARIGHFRGDTRIDTVTIAVTVAP